MPYDHRDRVGNEGDVVKHAVLARLVEELLETGSEEPFVYAESHTGWPFYSDLPADGRWRYGIGPFSHRLLSISDFGGKESVHKKCGNLMAYKRACFDREVVAHGDYPGSSRIVQHLLEAAGRSYRFRLWDSSASVWDELRNDYGNNQRVTVTCGDGYDGIATVDQASLVLVDPVDVRKDKTRILATLKCLNNRGIPFLCWTALVQGQDMAFIDFRFCTEPDFSVHWVTWTPKVGTTVGCQITVPQGIWGSITAETIGDVLDLMKEEWTD